MMWAVHWLATAGGYAALALADWCDTTMQRLHGPMEMHDGHNTVWCQLCNAPWPCRPFNDATRRQNERADMWVKLGERARQQL